MTLRQERILRFCDLNGQGLEIGASFNPIAPKKSGYHIEVLDYLGRDELLQKYKGQPSTPDHIEELVEEVDYVWRGERYADLVKHHYDFIISSHLMEHVPDMIGHINDCCEILNDGGVYSLAIPDKRYGFDVMRKETTAQDAIGRIGMTRYTDEMVVSYVTGVVKNGGEISWGKLCAKREFRPVYSEEETERIKKNPGALDLDIHASVFSPGSFAAMMDELYRRGLIHMPLVFVDEDTEYGEFYAVFKKGAGAEEKESFRKKECGSAVKLKRRCRIDRIAAQDGYLIVEGFSSVRAKPPARTTLYIGNTEIPTVRKMRPDLSGDINSNKFGFFCLESLDALKKGAHLLRVVSRDEEGHKARYKPTFLIIKSGKVIDLTGYAKRIKKKMIPRRVRR